MNLLLILGVVLAVTLAFALAMSARRRTATPEPQAGVCVRKLEPKVVEVRDEPDEPTGFGPKSLWIATRAPSAQALAEALDLDEPLVSDWKSGLTAADAYPGDYVFVTPPVNGWVIAVGVGLPDPGDPKLLPRWRSTMAAVSQRFAEAWFFATHRVSSYSAWARYSAGNEQRLFAYAEGQLIYNYGEPLAEEVDLIGRLPDPVASESDPLVEEGEGREPDEGDVLQLAGVWTIDPSTIDSLDLPPSVGILGKMRQ